MFYEQFVSIVNQYMAMLALTIVAIFIVTLIFMGPKTAFVVSFLVLMIHVDMLVSNNTLQPWQWPATVSLTPNHVAALLAPSLCLTLQRLFQLPCSLPSVLRSEPGVVSQDSSQEFLPYFLAAINPDESACACGLVFLLLQGITSFMGVSMNAISAVNAVAIMGLADEYVNYIMRAFELEEGTPEVSEEPPHVARHLCLCSCNLL